MLHPYLKLISIIALVFLALILAAHTLGASQPLNPALRGFTEGCEDKPQPCWYGIEPGVTTLTELGRIQHEKVSQVILASRDSCQMGITGEKQLVYSIWIQQCQGLTIGDFMVHLGQPQFLINDCDGSTDYIFNNSIRVTSTRIWNGPFSKLRSASVNGAHSITLRESNVDYAYLWQGFRSRQTYQRLQPQIRCVSRG